MAEDKPTPPPHSDSPSPLLAGCATLFAGLVVSSAAAVPNDWYASPPVGIPKVASAAAVGLLWCGGGSVLSLLVAVVVAGVAIARAEEAKAAAKDAPPRDETAPADEPQ